MMINFADGITNISLSGSGLVRFEFGVIEQPSEGSQQQQGAMKATQQIVMPLEGFLRAFGAQEQVIQKLIADGVVKRKDQDLTPLV